MDMHMVPSCGVTQRKLSCVVTGRYGRYERKLAESARILTAQDANTMNRTMSHGSVQNEHVREQPTLVIFSSVFCPMPIGYS